MRFCWHNKKFFRKKSFNKKIFINKRINKDNGVYNNNAFTIVEMVVVIAILGLVIALISNVLSFNVRQLEIEDNVVEYRYNSKLAGDLIVEKMKDARDEVGNITLGISGSSVVYGYPYTNYLIVDVSENNPSQNALLWFDKSEGVLKDIDGNTRAENILSISIEDNTEYYNITVTSGAIEGRQENGVYKKALSKEP